MSDTIDTMIRRCEFTKDEILTATHGECMWFAIALHDIMSDRLIKNRLVVAAPSTSPEAHWCHALVEHQHGYYDIRGEVYEKDVHTEFNTHIMRESSRQKLISRFPMINTGIKIEFWNKRLIANAASLSLDA